MSGVYIDPERWTVTFFFSSLFDHIHSLIICLLPFWNSVTVHPLCLQNFAFESCIYFYSLSSTHEYTLSCQIPFIKAVFINPPGKFIFTYIFSIIYISFPLLSRHLPLWPFVCAYIYISIIIVYFSTGLFCCGCYYCCLMLLPAHMLRDSAFRFFVVYRFFNSTRERLAWLYSLWSDFIFTCN